MNKQSLNKALIALVLALGFSTLAIVTNPQIVSASPSSSTVAETLAKSVDNNSQKLDPKNSTQQCKGETKMVGTSCLPITFAPEVRTTRKRTVLPQVSCTAACVSGKRRVFSFCINC